LAYFGYTNAKKLSSIFLIGRVKKELRHITKQAATSNDLVFKQAPRNAQLKPSRSVSGHIFAKKGKAISLSNR
jgi:hypothetical protein